MHLRFLPLTMYNVIEYVWEKDTARGKTSQAGQAVSH